MLALYVSFPSWLSSPMAGLRFESCTLAFRLPRRGRAIALYAGSVRPAARLRQRQPRGAGHKLIVTATVETIDLTEAGDTAGPEVTEVDEQDECQENRMLVSSRAAPGGRLRY